uniref:Uncharacterized protein n=1 Tax=virus sp. ctE0n6 TaxID=2827985 RepID=A0A8S5RF47_9VIRU|nr:MAG TPA: hypothetical protein [virus sp. ctE0n6]
MAKLKTFKLKILKRKNKCRLCLGRVFFLHNKKKKKGNII